MRSGLRKRSPPSFEIKFIGAAGKRNFLTMAEAHVVRILHLMKDLSSKDDADWGAPMRNPVEFREWFKVLFRTWRPHLSPNQFLVVLFIFDRTAAWGKEWEVILNRQFLKGVTGKDGKEYASGLRISAPPLIAAIRHLHEIGAIFIRPTKRFKAYSLNYEWNPENMSLKTPKRLQGLQLKAENEGKETLPVEGKETLSHKNRKEKCYAKAMGYSTSIPASVSESVNELSPLIAKAKEKSAASRQRKIAKWTVASALPLWLDTHRSEASDVIPLATTKTDGIILHRYGARWLKASKGRSVEGFTDFLSWSIRRWPLLRAEVFGWMKTASPAVPSIKFFVRFSDAFETAFAESAKFDAMSGMSAKDREVARLISKGMDKDVAERDVDARLGLTKATKQAERAAQELKQQRILAANDQAVKVDAEKRNAKWKERAKKTKPSEAKPLPSAFEEWR